MSLVLRHMQGFDVPDTLPFSQQYFVDGGNNGQSTLVAGRVPGSATAVDAGRFGWDVYNTLFAETNYHTQDNAQNITSWNAPVCIAHFNFSTPLATPFFNGVIVFRFDSTASGPQVSLALLAATQLQIAIGGDGRNFTAPGPGYPTSISPIPNVLAGGQWYNIRIRVQAGAGSGTVDVLLDGVNVLSLTGLTIANIDATVIRWQALSGPSQAPSWDDYVVWSSTNLADTFLPEVQVDSVLMGTDVSAAWTPGYTGGGFPPNPYNGHNWSVINDHSGHVFNSQPDLDIAFVASALGGPVLPETYQPRKPLCHGLVQGVALKVFARNAGGGTDPLTMLCNLTPVGMDLTMPVGPPNYVAAEVIVPVNPATGLPWVDRDIAGTTWGVQIPTTTSAHLTALWLEKVVDVSGLPFKCGGALIKINKHLGILGA